LYNAMGSVKEIECQLIIAERLEYLKKDTSNELMEELDDVGKMLRGFIDYVLRREVK